MKKRGMAIVNDEAFKTEIEVFRQDISQAEKGW